MKYIIRLLTLLAAAWVGGSSLAQEDDTVSTAELFSSMISGNAEAGNAADFRIPPRDPIGGTPFLANK